MTLLPTQISNFIEKQFPEVYREDGPSFVSFVKAYYEWLEQNFQLLTLQDNKGFEVGLDITQGDIKGTIVANLGEDLLVKVDGNETFSCMSMCSDYIPVKTTNAGVEYSTFISRGGTTKRLGPIFQARNLLNYTDIDRTIDLFVLQFKEKYLKNIQFDTATNKKLMIKNSLDLYRSKGTEQSIDLFFRLVFGLKAEVKRPSDFLFKPSEAEWNVPKYIEISSLNPLRAIELVGKEITGVSSEATAFVEKYVKIKTPGGFSHILLVSNIKGHFLLNELLRDEILYPDSPTIYGSLSELEILNPVGNFKIGDIIDLKSNTGIGAKGRVVEVRFASGQVDFELEFGGYGFTVNSANSIHDTRIEIADYLVTLSDVQVGNTIASVAILDPGSGYANSDVITLESNYGRDSIGSISTDASGAITEIQLADRGSGFIFPTPNDIPYSIFTSAGTGATVLPTEEYSTKYLNLLEPIHQNTSFGSSSGYAISIPSRGVVKVTSITGSFVVGDVLFQVDPTLGVIASGIITSVASSLDIATITLQQLQGCFRTNYQIKSSSSGEGILVAIEGLTFSIKQTSEEDFQLDSNSFITSTQTGMRGLPILLSGGSNASISVSSLEQEEVVRINTNILIDIADTPLSNTSVLDLKLAEFGDFETLTIGKIRSVGSINPGENYTSDPEILVLQPYISSFQKRDLELIIDSVVGSFSPNETIEQKTEIEAKQFTVSDTADFVINESVFITDSDGATLASGVIYDILSSTQLEVIGLDSESFVGETLRSNENESISFTILAELFVTRELLGRGIIKQIGETTLTIERLTFADNYRTNQIITGLSSGATALVTDFYEVDTSFLGLNANILTRTISTDGAVSKIKVVDSGFGFINNQEGSFEVQPGQNGTIKIFNDGLGVGSGNYKSIKGFLSDESKLFDGSYYQEYSYDILSRIPIDKYSKMFKKVMHTAGTKFFGSILLESELDLSDKEINKFGSISDSELTISNTSPYTVLSPTLTAAPGPWGSNNSMIDSGLRDNLSPTVDRSNINIEIRN